MMRTMWHTISEFYLWTLILFTFNNCVLLQKPSSGENPTFFNIGGVLSNGESEKNFSETIAVSMTGFTMQPFIIINSKALLCSIEYSLNWK